jgi:MFS family permease
MSARGLPAGSAPPRSFAALRNRDFRIIFVMNVLTMMADNIEHVISYWVIFQKFHSPELGGVAMLTHWIPYLLFSVWSGALADRWDARRMIQIGLVLFMGVTLGWGVLFYTDSAEMWHAAVLLTVHGFAGVFWIPPAMLMIHRSVGGETLQSAVRLNSTGMMLGIFLGPAVGGALMLGFGPAAGLLLNAAFYLPFFVWLIRAPHGRTPVGHAAPPRGGLLETLRAVAHNRPVVLMLLLAGGASFFVGSGFVPHMPEFAHDLHTANDDVSYSLLLTANAAGALFGGLLLESRGLLAARPGAAIALALAWSLTMIGFALTRSYPVALALMLVAGVLQLAFMAMAQTLVQVNAPSGMQGRVVGLFTMASNGMRAFSGVTIGMLGGIVGVHSSLALSATALLVATLMLGSLALRLR